MNTDLSSPEEINIHCSRKIFWCFYSIVGYNTSHKIRKIWASNRQIHQQQNRTPQFFLCLSFTHNLAYHRNLGSDVYN